MAPQPEVKITRTGAWLIRYDIWGEELEANALLSPLSKDRVVNVDECNKSCLFGSKEKCHHLNRRFFGCWVKFYNQQGMEIDAPLKVLPKNGEKMLVLLWWIFERPLEAKVTDIIQHKNGESFNSHYCGSYTNEYVSKLCPLYPLVHHQHNVVSNESIYSII